ncbi:MAG: histidine phosphatase family protein [Clostridia bacterium]|nr:histidine phosphatase family protein [Clostridia bacterium]
MRIIFVRHGEPDYEKDCLTETGKLQAEAAARRLEREGISEIYASPMGRAAETAACTARRLNLPVETLDFMHEISWGGPGIPEEGHPWTVSDWMICRDDFDFYHDDWREHPSFKGNVAVRYLEDISGRFDQFLLRQGYRHEGTRFFCETDQAKTIAVFSHGGSGACVLAHLLALPFPYVCTVLPYEFTSIIILEFPVRPGAFVHPRIELFNDAAHILNLSSGLVFQQRVDGSAG